MQWAVGPWCIPHRWLPIGTLQFCGKFQGLRSLCCCTTGAPCLSLKVFRVKWWGDGSCHWSAPTVAKPSATGALGPLLRDKSPRWSARGAVSLSCAGLWLKRQGSPSLPAREQSPHGCKPFKNNVQLGGPPPPTLCRVYAISAFPLFRRCHTEKTVPTEEGDRVLIGLGSVHPTWTGREGSLEAPALQDS